MPPAARRRRGQPISTAFVEGTVNEIVAKRMSKAQQVRWSRATAQPFLGVRAAVLNDTLEDAFRRRHPGFRPAQGKRVMAEAARFPPIGAKISRGRGIGWQAFVFAVRWPGGDGRLLVLPGCWRGRLDRG